VNNAHPGPMTRGTFYTGPVDTGTREDGSTQSIVLL